MTDTHSPPPTKKQKIMAFSTTAATAPSHLPPPSASTFTIALPPILLRPSSSPAQLIGHGAEAHLYKTTHFVAPSLFPPSPSSSSSSSPLSQPAALKYRPPKPYRHPILDARLTRQRIFAEARILARCRRDGVAVPAVLAVDEMAGWLLAQLDGAGREAGVPVAHGDPGRARAD